MLVFRSCEGLDKCHEGVIADRLDMIEHSLAPYNPNPQWPRGYYAVLAAMGVKQTHFSYYAYWVRELFKCHPGRRRRELRRAEIEAFLGDMTGNERFQEWQVRQARCARNLPRGQTNGKP